VPLGEGDLVDGDVPQVLELGIALRQVALLDVLDEVPRTRRRNNSEREWTMTRRQLLAEALKLTGGLALFASCFGGCDGPGDSGPAEPAYDPQGRRIGDDPESKNQRRMLQQRQYNREAGR
jgi:hypothetical protein